MTNASAPNGGGRLAGRSILITGGARGQGEQEARRFAAEGAQLLITDVLDDQGEAVAKELGARYRHLDVSDEAQWQAAVSAAVSAYGKLDGLVNNAGILRLNALTDTPLAEYQQVITVNQVGCFLGMKTAAPAITEAGGGTVVNTASYTAHAGMALTTAYAASKGAILAMTRVAALELAPSGIRVNAMCPGAVDTPMTNPSQVTIGSTGETLGDASDAAAMDEAVRELYGRVVPLGRIGRPQEVADLALFLSSAESSYVTGQPFVIDGGWLCGVSIF
ncbi:SDR family NAD(P)-dependent oxidoreductase [Phaeacidiphilus oryzae]|jgi:3alpha(or 20beta)-hydroxysteroid dehydrogenase|uniref:SDR family NAD(P)-dependent oxidoreductase n=1 Tax=Phaeacidiphilus oryzae TaxID=348818 RepID=UPI00055EE428|nr:SDR family oxidoreductase [Phaeacidiphilus oryzae]